MFMKQMKFLLVALMTVLMGVSVTSCMKGDDNNTVQLSNFVRVNTFDFPISFKDVYGIKLIPTQSVTTTKPMALIAYQYDRSTVDANTTSINITLLGDPYFFDEDYVSSSIVAGNAPLVTLEPTTYYGTIKGGFFDKNTLILPLAYKYKKYDSETEQAAENSLHSFTMTYDEETGYNNGVLTLTLHHQIANNLTEKRGDNALDYKAFNISAIKNKLSGNLTKVTVVIKENQKDDSFAETDVKDVSYSFEYNFKE